MYFDKTGFANYFLNFFKILFGEFKENIGWVFGFYEKNSSDILPEFIGPEFVRSESNIFKIIVVAPFKLISMTCFYIIMFCSMIIGIPFALLYNIKFNF